jgi:hypothetical protein
MRVLRSVCRFVRPLLIGLSMSSVATTQLLAQAGELFNPGEYYIDGIQPACGEFETLVAPEGPDLIHPDGTFTIVVNGPAFDPLPTQLKLFVYYQTCNAMIFDVREDAIQLADTLTARRGIAEGWLTAAVAEAICETDMLVEAGWTAAPDADRCAAIYEIMRQAFQ